jgi:hypothetical protein
MTSNMEREPTTIGTILDDIPPTNDLLIYWLDGANAEKARYL